MVISAPVILKLNICLWSFTHWHQAFPLCQKWPHKGIEAAWINRKVSWRNLGRLKSTPVCKACLGALSPLNFWEWQFLILYWPNRRWSPLTVRDHSCISSQSTAVSCSSEGWMTADLLFFFLKNDFIYIYFMCIHVLLACVYTTKTRRRQGAGSPGTWVASSCVLPYGCQESSQGLLRKQQGPFNHRAIFPALSSFVFKLTFELVEYFLYAERGSSHL